MRLHLFFKELFGGPTKMMQYFGVVMVVYLLLCCNLLLFFQNTDSSVQPDVLWCGSKTASSYSALSDELYSLLNNTSDNDLEVYKLNFVFSYTYGADGLISALKYSCYSFDHSFFTNKISDSLATGSIPQKGKKEAVLGPNLAKELNLKVGDVISNRPQKIGTTDAAFVPLDFGRPDVTEEYKVSGILNPTSDIFDFSVLVDSSTVANTDANQIWIYLPNSKSKKVYENLSISPLHYGVSQIEDIYIANHKTFRKRAFNTAYILILISLMDFFLISYVFKGVGRKLGVLKAIGISEKYIIQSYYFGLVIFNLCGTVLGALFMHTCTAVLNKMKASLYEIEYSAYKVDTNMYILLALSFVVSVTVTYMGLYYRLYKISPKVAMTMKG